MPMTGNDMRELRRAAGLTQEMLAEQIGVSRKTINQAEGEGEEAVSGWIEAAVRGITLTAAAHLKLIEHAKEAHIAGDSSSMLIFENAARLLRGGFATDERTIYNLALTAAKLEQRLQSINTR